jgi:uncharacterized cupin superfamily protein
MSWFVRNIREVQWYDAGPFGVYGDFEQGDGFPEFGFNFGVVWPGQPVALYHREDHQEGFLVLSGECLLIVEGEERALKQWDYFHCPAGVAHILVGAGEGPAFVVAVGSRVGPANLLYPVDPVASKHGAGAEKEATTAAEGLRAVPETRADPLPRGFLAVLSVG